MLRIHALDFFGGDDNGVTDARQLKVGSFSRSERMVEWMRFSASPASWDPMPDSPATKYYPLVEAAKLVVQPLPPQR